MMPEQLSNDQGESRIFSLLQASAEQHQSAAIGMAGKMSMDKFIMLMTLINECVRDSPDDDPMKTVFTMAGYGLFVARCETLAQEDRPQITQIDAEKEA